MGKFLEQVGAKCYRVSGGEWPAIPTQKGPVNVTFPVPFAGLEVGMRGCCSRTGCSLGGSECDTVLIVAIKGENYTYAVHVDPDNS